MKHKIDVYEDVSKENITPGTAIEPLYTNQRHDILATILAERQALRQHHALREQQRLIDCTSFAAFFGKRVQVEQQEIDAYCGFNIRTSQRVRADLTIYQQLDAKMISKDPRGGWNRKLTNAEIKRMDEAMEDDPELCTHSWKVIAKEVGIEGHCTQVLRTAMQDLGWHSRRALKKTKLSEAQRKMRLEAWKEVYCHWRDHHFKLVRYSDEKHFGEEYTGPMWVKRKPGTREDPCNIIYDEEKKRKRRESGKQVSREHPENDDEEVPFRLHVWGAVGWKFKSKLIFYAPGDRWGKINQEQYTELILKGEVATWKHRDQWVLEEDRDSGHGVHGTREPYGIQDGSLW